MRPFLYRVLGACLPLLALLVFVNFTGDAARIFSNNYEQTIVRILLSGKSATNISNFNERQLQQKWIAKLPFIPAIVTLGSSKSMLINSGMLNGDTLINNSVSGADLTDIENIYHLYLSAKKLPRIIILGLDPWTLNDGAAVQHITQKTNRHKTGNSQQSGTVQYTSSDKFASLFSLTYFQQSLPVLFERIRNNDQPIATANKYNVSNTKNPDGSLTYGNAYRNSSDATVKSRVEVYLKRGDIANLDLLNSVSHDKWRQLLQLVENMQNHHIKVVFLLTPYHPTVYEILHNRFPSGLNPEYLINKLAVQKKITLIGSFDPGKCGLSDRNFYDAVHCNEEGMRLILSNFH